jgi:hypothetical protein
LVHHSCATPARSILLCGVPENSCVARLHLADFHLRFSTPPVLTRYRRPAQHFLAQLDHRGMHQVRSSEGGHPRHTMATQRFVRHFACNGSPLTRRLGPTIQTQMCNMKVDKCVATIMGTDTILLPLKGSVLRPSSYLTQFCRKVASKLVELRKHQLLKRLLCLENWLKQVKIFSNSTCSLHESPL